MHQRLQRTLDAIKQHVDETGWPPTYAELATLLGVRSRSTVMYRLRALEELGAIERGGGTRALRILWRNSHDQCFDEQLQHRKGSSETEHCAEK